MYKLMIVDDEQDIRDGLKLIVDWSKLGYEVVDTFCDGKDAIEYLESHVVDVILTDIKMNVMSGLDVAKYVYDQELQTKVVILSGFREFELAKTAMQYDVVNYLVKPTNFKELHQMFRELRCKLDQEKALTRKRRELKVEMINALKEQFYIDVTAGGLTDHNKIITRMELIGFNSEMMSNRCSTIVLKIEDYNSFIKDSWTRGKDNLTTVMRNIFCGENDTMVYHMIRFNQDLLHLFIMEKNSSDVKSYDEKASLYINKTRESIHALIGITLKEQSNETYENIQLLADNNTRVIVPTTTTKDNIEQSISPDDLDVLYEQRKLFLSYALEKDSQGVRDIFDTIIKKLSLLELHMLQEFIINLLVSMKNMMYSKGSQSYEAISGYRYVDIFKLESQEAIRLWADDLFTSLETFYANDDSKVEIKAIRLAKKYMEDHFSEDVSLDEVAEHVYLNPVYLSRLFKQTTGENYTDYLITIRMEKAKELLEESHLKAYEICEQVGYGNAKYFYKIFRKYTGYTTKEYRALHCR